MMLIYFLLLCLHNVVQCQIYHGYDLFPEKKWVSSDCTTSQNYLTLSSCIDSCTAVNWCKGGWYNTRWPRSCELCRDLTTSTPTVRAPSKMAFLREAEASLKEVISMLTEMDKEMKGLCTKLEEVELDLEVVIDSTNKTCANDCRSPKVRIGGQCLSFSDDETTSWGKAVQKCVSQQGRLASLWDPTGVMNYANTHYNGVEFWAGGFVIECAGAWSWTWLDQRPIPSGFPWAPPCGGFPQQPDCAGGYQTCLVANWFCNGYYDDQNCDNNPHRYICEY